MHQALISLGGNLGETSESITSAYQKLNAHPKISILSHSSEYQTAAVGELAGQVFTNAAATLSIALTPIELLDYLQQIETSLGRTRTIHWGPRTIDLDLILFDQDIVESERLRIPHPHAFYRRFVLDPAVEIAGEWKHPEFDLTLAQLRNRLLVRPLPIFISTEKAADESRFNQILDAVKVGKSTRQPDTAVIIMDDSGKLDYPHTVTVDPGEDSASFLRQVLIAATDAPVRLIS